MISSITIGQQHQLKKLSEQAASGSTASKLTAAAILSGKEESYFYNLPISQALGELKVLNDELAKQQKHSRSLPERYYVLNGRKLELHTNIARLTTAQYIDFVSIIEKDSENIAALLSTLLIPEGHGYNEGYELSELRKELNESFLWQDADNIAFFFLTLYQSYITSSLICLAWKLRKMIVKSYLTKGMKTERKRLREMLRQVKRAKRIGSI